MSNKPTPRPRTIRCAIYTRKSTEEGLDQQYNSLDAQRDAGESFIRSQVNEGWEIVHDRYDDGGFSGGNIERPALKRLMEDIEAGRIDCVIVYKVDRLSRSLLDFARVMETFDKYSVSFVSVTQHFNTTHLMGRLTLNILLSFAQFEREIIGERIRDKLAAQCWRGQWTGGYPVLGYDVDRTERTPKLVINSEEATKVRRIFSLYLELKNLLPVVHELDERGWTDKLWHSKKGLPKGGRVFDKGSVHALLTNPIYCGKIKHKTDLYQGQHQAIVDTDIFDRVQAQLRENGFNRGNRMPSKHGGLLKGIIRCPHCNVAMVPNMTKRNSIVYRYYTCVRAIKRGRQSCRHPSLPAGEIEAAVLIRCEPFHEMRGYVTRSSVRPWLLPNKAERRSTHIRFSLRGSLRGITARSDSLLSRNDLTAKSRTALPIFRSESKWQNSNWQRSIGSLSTWKSKRCRRKRSKMPSSTSIAFGTH